MPHQLAVCLPRIDHAARRDRARMLKTTRRQQNNQLAMLMAGFCRFQYLLADMASAMAFLGKQNLFLALAVAGPVIFAAFRVAGLTGNTFNIMG